MQERNIVDRLSILKNLSPVEQQERKSKQRKGEGIMFYVYSKHIKTGKEEFVNCYQTAQEALEKITNNYNIDKRTCQSGEYYYFMKQR